MDISVDLAKRYKIKSESYIDNTGNGSFHNHYEYYDYLVAIEPTDDDVISYQGKEVCRGRFLGCPNDDKSLYLVKSDGKMHLYEDDVMLMNGKNLFIYGDLCVQQDQGKYYIIDLKDNSEITTIEDTTFSGYDAEHKLFAFGDKVYALDGDKLSEYNGDAKVLKFDLPNYNIKAEAHIEGGKVCQTNQYESIAKHSYTVGVQNSDGKLLVFVQTSEDKEADKQTIIDLYIKKLANYDGDSVEKEEIDTIKQVYSILYNEDISRQKDRDGHTLFERFLCCYSRPCFWALRDFYSEEFKKETDTKLPVSFSSYGLETLFSKHKMSDDDMKLLADFIARNPKSIYSFSSKVLEPLAKANPEMVVDWVKNSDSYEETTRKIKDLKELGGELRSLAGEILEKNGIQFYFREDFVLAPNKEFWETIKDREFGYPRVAFGRLCEGLQVSTNQDSSYDIIKKMLMEFMDKNPGVASYTIMNWYEDQYNKFLVDNGLTQDEKIIAKVESYKEKSKTQHSLDAIQYGKRDISLKCKLDDIVDFTDFDYAAPRYHLSDDSRTTFLNEMLIYGKGIEAAYALSHGASPFQKVEFFRGKKTGMPFAGVFLRTLKDGFAGVQPLMNEIARNLDAKSGQQIITDIEKSLGQNLRQMPAVTQIMKNMYDTFMHAKFEYEKKHKEEMEQEQNQQKKTDDSRKFKREHQQEIDDLDKAYRIANRIKIDAYSSIFDGKETFSFSRFSEKLLYTQENLEKVKEKIAQLETHHQLANEIEKKLHEKDENTGKSMIDRFGEFGYKIYTTDDGVVYREGDNHYSDTTIPFSNDSVLQLDEFITKREEKQRIEQEREAEKQRQLIAQAQEQRQKEQYKAMGLPSNVQVWHRVGAGTMCGEGWVIKSDGLFREPDTFNPKKRFSSDGFKCWEQILPDEVALSWKKGSAVSEHDFEVVYMPKNGLSEQQKEQILKIEEKIQNEWKDRKGMSSGEPSPSVGYGWNICGRKKPLLRDDEYNFSQQDKHEAKNTDTSTHKEVEDMPDRPIETNDLAALLNHFGGSYKK